MEYQHTPLRWHVSPVRTDDGRIRIYGPIVNDQSTTPALTESPRDAAFIVRACNSHYELLAALIGLVDCAGITALPGYKDELGAAMIAARAVIAKVEGGA